jgi:hypothetical protein
MKNGLAYKTYDVKLTKQAFGYIMHDPEASEEEIQQALQMLQTAGGYENLED